MHGKNDRRFWSAAIPSPLLAGVHEHGPPIESELRHGASLRMANGGFASTRRRKAAKNRRTPKPSLLAAIVCTLLVAVTGFGRELSDAENTLRELLGPGTPEPILLWPGKPPRFAENPPTEVMTERASITRVSEPTLTAYLPAKEKSTGIAIIVCAGG